jgi:hypothetical protein
MLSMATDNYLPRKVRAKAHQLGVHNDCLLAPSNLCPSCYDAVMLAFDFFYGEIPTEGGKLAAIAEDFRHDLEDEDE